MSLLIASDLLCIFIRNSDFLYCLRFIHGVASGGTLGIVYGAISRKSSPERVVGASLVIELAQGSLAYLILPSMLTRFGMTPLFLCMAVTELLGLFVLLALPRSIYVHNPQNKRNESFVVSSLLGARPVLVILAIAGLFLFQGSRFMAIGYGFNIGQYFQHTRAFVSQVGGAAAWLAGFGAFLAMLGSRERKRFVPLVVTGLTVTLSSIVFIYGGTSPMIYAVTSGVAAVFMFFSLPYYFGVCLALDGSGRLGMWASFISKLGLSVGPALGGWIMTHYGLVPLLWLGTVGGVIAVILSASTARLLDKQTPVRVNA